MKILIYPDHLVFVTQGCDEVASIQQLTGWNMTTQFSRAPKTTFSVEATGWCSLELAEGIYEIRLNDSPPVVVLLPHGIFLTARVARELLRQPGTQMSTPTPRHLGRALSDMFRLGFSWAMATRILGLGPYGEVGASSEPPDEE